MEIFEELQLWSGWQWGNKDLFDECGRFCLFRLKILLSSILDVYRLFGYIDTRMYVMCKKSTGQCQ